MSVKEKIKYILPYGIATKYLKKRDDSYSLLKMLNTHQQCGMFKKTISSKFDTIVSVCGFGYSGSGALVDLLREYNSANVYGLVEKEATKTKNTQNVGEIDFLRLAGGLFDVESVLSCKNVFLRDQAIHRFVKLFERSMLFRKSKVIQQLTCEFLNELLDFSINNMPYPAYNRHLKDSDKQDCIFFIKQLDVASYRELCSRFVCAFFNSLYVGKKRIFVADQLLSDFCFNVNHYKAYIPNLKLLYVYRDPRDVFAFARKKSILWIPNDDVEKFVRWYKICVGGLSTDGSDYLAIRYEDLIFDYDNQVKLIEEYLNLSSSEHVHVKECFDPSISCNYVGLWEKYSVSRDDIETIEKELSDWCYSRSKE